MYSSIFGGNLVANIARSGPLLSGEASGNQNRHAFADTVASTWPFWMYHATAIIPS